MHSVIETGVCKLGCCGGHKRAFSHTRPGEETSGVGDVFTRVAGHLRVRFICCKPTKLMENVLELLGSRDASFLFIRLFLSQLPPPACTALASSPLLRTKDYQALAEEADMIPLASRQYVVHAMPPTQLPWGDGMVRAPAGGG